MNEIKDNVKKIKGGLHTKGLFDEKLERDKPLVTIVTACLNSQRYIEGCIESVASQIYENIEYIIIDGGSTDKTLESIRKYDNKIAYWVSEPDAGFYDAINKGSRLARGDYILYLNSDDYLYSKDSIKDIIHFGCEGDYPLLIVGKVRVALDNEALDWYWPPNKTAVYKYNPPHQGVLIHKDIYKKLYYNTIFKISGDTELWSRLRRERLFQIKFVDCMITVVRLGGLSNWITMEYRRSTEREIINFLYSKTNIFSFIVRLSALSVLATFKKILVIILGRKNYYKYILYRVYLFRKGQLLRKEAKGVLH